MKYFTKDELEDIANKLIENPTRETLKILNDSYNGNGEMEKNLTNETSLVPNIPPVIAPLPNVSIETPLVQMVNEVESEKMIPSVEMNSSVVASVPTVENLTEVNPTPSFNVPNIELSNTVMGVNNNMQVPSFELPKLETPLYSNQKNEPINFSGNLWDAPKQEIGNLMQTTDNFSAMSNTIPNNEVSISSAPFFGVSNEPVNNPIPVGGPSNNMPTMGPSMFGEFEQNYM